MWFTLRSRMEGIFNSKDLYEYLEEQKQMSISKTREISLYYKATSKSVEDDEYSLRIWMDYIQLLMEGTRDMSEARETFKMIKLRFCKFYNYWEAYIRFEICSGNENLSKIVQQSIDFIHVKEFVEKTCVLEYLECVMSCITNRSDLSVFRTQVMKNDVHSRISHECRENIGNVVDKHDTTTSIISKRHHESYGEGIPIQFAKESYLHGITVEINTALGKMNGNEERFSPRDDSSKCREKIMINGREIEILRQIGKGGSSKVYKVLVGNNIYALKKVELIGDEKMLHSYINEIDLLYTFKGTSETVEIIDHEMGPDYLYILLEYGEIDLAKMIKNGNLSMNFIRDVWEQMLLIVKRVHMARIIHCDLKPANFLFVRGRVKLIDFGISKVIRNDTTSILSEEQCGTVNYMSPEAVTQNKSKMSRSSDIWSLGCILYEMVHSKPPLHEYPNLIQKIQKLQEYSEFKYMSDGLATTVMKECLVRDPKKRPSIDHLLSHRFLTGGIDPEYPRELVRRILTITGSDIQIDDVIDRLNNEN